MAAALAAVSGDLTGPGYTINIATPVRSEHVELLQSELVPVYSAARRSAVLQNSCRTLHHCLLQPSTITPRPSPRSSGRQNMKKHDTVVLSDFLLYFFRLKL